MPGMSHIVPPPIKTATFHWALEPPGGVSWGRVYTDGSRLDGPTALLARNGWAFVAVNEADEIFAIAYGVPPDWIEDIPGTEAWALLQAASLALPGTTFMVDCQPCVDTVHKRSCLREVRQEPTVPGPHAACRSHERRAA